VLKAYEAGQLALVVLTPDERVASATAGAARILGGVSKEENWRDRLSPSEREVWERLIESARESGVVKNTRMDVLDRDGHTIPLLVNIQTVGSDFSSPDAYLLTLEPYSETWQTAGEAALETFRRLEQLSMVGQLASSFAHEIKSPLHVILSTTELLLETDNLPQELRESLEMMERNAERAAATAHALMDLSSAQHVELVPDSLQLLVERTLTLLEIRLRSKKIEVVKSLQPAAPILMDVHHLQAVVYNLVTNAADSMVGGGRLSVSVRPSPDGREVLLEVGDTGSGMEPGMLARIGDPFFTTKPDGTGMGVFLTKRVVREHHAKIAYDSKRGKGTTVTITFPKA
jgi:signal transduction histidine kinase